MTPGSASKRVVAASVALFLLEGVAAAADASARAKPPAVFLIQTGAFKSDEKAREHCNPLTAAGFPLHVVKTGTSQRSIWFVCRSVDAFERNHANEIIASLRSDAGVAEAILLPVSHRAAGSPTAPSAIPNDLRAQFEKFLGERDSQPVELFEEFMRRQGARSN
jgi:hypothetical protein